MARILSAIFCCPNIHQKCINRSSPFTLMDLFLTFLSIGSFLADIGTDIIVIIQYYRNGHIIWMLLTTVLVCVPSSIVQIFSIRWYIVDGTASTFLWVVHVFQFGVLQRYINLLLLGLKVRQENTYTNMSKFNQQQSDICMLRLFESFMESAPQLVLQLYIMASTDEWNPWTGISAVASIFSLSWGIAAYSKAMRNVQPGKHRLSWWGLLFQSLWRIGMVSSRVLSMVLFAAAYGSWLILIMFLHWLFMTIWVFFQNTDFCTTWWEERLYNCVVGVIYCFCYFNVKEGQSRYRMSVYYVLMIAQNLSFLLPFTVDRSAEGLKYMMMLFVPFGIVIGMGSLLLYYRFFHPSGPIKLFQSATPKDIMMDEIDHKKDSRCDCCTLKTCRKLRYSEAECTDSSPLTQKDCSSDEQRKVIANTSKISIKLSDVSVLCSPNLHRSHSLNCSVLSHGENKKSDLSYFASRSQKSFANHFTNVNYHFRTAAKQNDSSINIHCSCLVLTNDSETNTKDVCLLAAPKHSKSLPNLGKSSECDISEKATLSLKTYPSETRSLNTCSFEIGSVNIDKDHIIRIKV